MSFSDIELLAGGQLGQNSICLAKDGSQTTVLLPDSAWLIYPVSKYLLAFLDKEKEKNKKKSG